MKAGKIILVVICMCIAMPFFYFYVVERALAINKFERYIKKQGISQEEIVEKHVFKNWKDGGYTVRLCLSSDEGKRYYYQYYLWTDRADEELRFDRMFLSVSYGGRSYYDPDSSRCRYPALKE